VIRPKARMKTISAASWIGSIAPVMAADRPEKAQGISALPWSVDLPWSGISPCISGISIIVVAGLNPEQMVMAICPDALSIM